MKNQRSLQGKNLKIKEMEKWMIRKVIKSKSGKEEKWERKCNSKKV